jgi:hypothetical protein
MRGLEKKRASMSFDERHAAGGKQHDSPWRLGYRQSNHSSHREWFAFGSS